MRYRSALTFILLLLVTGVMTGGRIHSSSIAESPSTPFDASAATLEDFDDILTELDLGFDDFGGNMGAINEEYLPTVELSCASPQACALRLDWDFGSGGEIFTGYFFSLFGLTDTLVTFDGTITETLFFPEHTLDLDDIDGVLMGQPRKFTDICLDLIYNEPEELRLRLELSDTVGGTRFVRKTITANTSPQAVCWAFRDEFTTPPGSANFDLHQAKLLTLVIEQRNVGDGVNNPLTGRLDIDRVRFTLDIDEMEPADDQALLDLLEKRTYQYFLDWSSRKPESLDIPQDRSTFGDLLTVGGIGFGIPAHIIGAERNWATRAESAARVVNILRVLDDPDAFGPEPVGRIGYRGWYYHFLGVDGRRKLNFDFPQTPEDESLNTVELSSIDTGLALMGILAAQSYYDGNDAVETEIRTRAQSIYDRVEWDFMLEPAVQQYYLGWKPNEAYEGPPFEIADADGLGHYAGVPLDPATLDYYTDEALILLLLGIGSETHPISAESYYSMILDRDKEGLIRTYPGALFTYQFLHAFIDTSNFIACEPVWNNNSRQAIRRVIDYATENPNGFATYSATAWGISANEGPFDEYSANGASVVAVANPPEEDGSVTYYAMLSAAGFGVDLRDEAVTALRAGWDRGHWHPRFGLPDAFHDDVSEINDDVSEINPLADALRQSGPWMNRSLFAIDQGPMLLHLENASSGLIRDLLGKNPNIQRALDRMTFPSPARILMQAESGEGDGTIRPRSNAWGDETVWLHAGESRTMTAVAQRGDFATLVVRYSNDNFGPSETVTILLDNTQIGSFVAEDTGNGGNGWNQFVWSEQLPIGTLATSEHLLEVAVTGGDGYGIEIDAVALSYYRSLLCSYAPLVARD